MTPHVVVFGELSPRARVHYTRFLLDNRVEFRRREADGRYVANIRLALPESGSVADSVGTTASVSEVEPRGAVDGASDSERVRPTVPARFQRLANLIALAGEQGARAAARTTGPYVKEARLVRLINEIYDARSEDVAAPPLASTGDSFARFVRQYLTNRFGLRKIVDQQCWELVEGLSTLQHRLDVELFVSFIEGKYADWALASFLSARSQVQRLLSTSAYRPTLHRSTGTASQLAKTKKRPAASLLSSATPIWLSKSQLEALGPLLFSSKTDDLHIEFTRAVRAFISSDPDASATRCADRALTVSEFLLLAVETYHKAGGEAAQTHPSPLERRLRAGGGGAEADGGSMTPKSVDTPVSSTGAVAFAFAEEERPAARPQGDDVQARLGSLLERAKLRAQQRQLGM